MSEFHYVRTLGEDGGVDACDGPAIGLDLETIIQDGLPPWNVALSIVAGLCEILDITDEDKEVHGDLAAKYVFVDETGAISIEGFGAERTRTRAPEGSPKGPATDLYGLGYVAYQLFCTHELPALPDDDPDAHDDGVIDAVLLIDLSGVPEEMQGDIQWYVAKLMSFDREDRPSAVEAWRTFIAFANAVDGPDVVQWCSDSLDGVGERREEGDAPRPGPAVGATDDATDEGDEDLGGPVMQQGPLAKGAINFGDGGAAKGQATAFWSRDAMKAALDKQPDEEEEDNFRPKVGGGSATAFWSKDDMQAMIEGGANAPRPKRASGAGDRRKQAQTLMMSPMAANEARHTADPAPQSAPPPRRQPAPPPQAPQPIIQGPQAGAPPPQRPPPHAPIPPAPAGGSNMGLIIGGVLVLLLVVVLGSLLLVGGGGALFMFSGSDATPVETPSVTPANPDPAPAAAPEPTKDTGGPAKDKKAATAPKPTPRPTQPTRPKPSPKPTSNPTLAAPKPAPRPRPAPAPVAPAPAPTGGPARVAFASTGRGTVSCAGSNTQFDGPATVSIDEYQLPATCLVTIEGKRGVFQVYGSGDVACNLEGTNVVCNKAAVQ